MSGQKYKRTNFDDDDNTSSAGTPPGVRYDPAVAFKVGANFWQNRTGLERLLFGFLVVLLILVVTLGILLGTKSSPPIPVPKPLSLCTTPACVTVASSIITAMDTGVDPCKDFYHYACGGWIQSNPIPSGQSRWTTFGSLWKENQLVMKNELEKPLNMTKSIAEKKARIYYQSCMDKNKTLEKLGAKPMLDLLEKIGGWNVNPHSRFDVRKWDFQKQLEISHSYGMTNFFSVWVGEDEKNSKVNILQLDQSGLGLVSREQYLNKSITEDKMLKAYLHYMTRVGVLLGGEWNHTEEQMLHVIEFEQELANITVPEEDRRDDMALYHKKTIKDLQDIAPFVNWLHYINNMTGPSRITVQDTEPIVVLAPKYLADISKWVQEALRTDKGKITINNYLKWHVVQTLVPYLSKAFRDAKKEFTEVIQGVTGGSEPWRYCTTDTDSTLGFALGAMFVRSAFHGESKKKAEVMIQEIKAAFKRNLPRLEWMDKETRKAAMEKANAVVDMIGFPAYILNTTALDARYQELEVKADEYFQNNVRDLKFNVKFSFDKLRKPPDKFSWSMTPPTVNAYYTPTKNEIVFPAGILQAPYYDKEYPKSLNFGGMGVVMGHELTHGFDDQGREYDKFGILRPWWNKDSIFRFKERTKCMVDQYSSYTVNNEHVRGKNTLGENIADNGGLKAAYNAYLDWVKHHGEELPLPGVNLTHRQLFFLAYAQVWCSASTKQADHLTILKDSHSPPKFRVVGALSNSKDFSSQFSCKEGAPMNPKKKCEVW